MFINAIEDAVDRIREFPARWAVIGVLYTIEQDYILILAIMPCSREPQYWDSRIEVEKIYPYRSR